MIYKWQGVDIFVTDNTIEAGVRASAVILCSSDNNTNTTLAYNGHPVE